MLLFFKLVLLIKMSTSQDFKTTFKHYLSCIFLSLRAQFKKPLCPRTPCTYLFNLIFLLTQTHKLTKRDALKLNYVLILVLASFLIFPGFFDQLKLSDNAKCKNMIKKEIIWLNLNNLIPKKKDKLHFLKILNFSSSIKVLQK